MASRFFKERDIANVIDRVNKELIDNVVGQTCTLYKIDVNHTEVNMYGETAKGGKLYKQGVEIPCLIESNDFDWNTDEFGPDSNQAVDFKFTRAKLIELGILPEVGDLIKWNYAYFEVHSTNENNLIGGNPDQNHDLIIFTHLTRQTRLNLVDGRRT